MNIQLGSVVVSSGREDGDVESGEEIGAVGGVVGDGDSMVEGEGENERSEVRRRSVEVEKPLLLRVLRSIIG